MILNRNKRILLIHYLWMKILMIVKSSFEDFERLINIFYQHYFLRLKIKELFQEE
jgi:hypothetical protein